MIIFINPADPGFPGVDAISRAASDARHLGEIDIFKAAPYEYSELNETSFELFKCRTLRDMLIEEINKLEVYDEQAIMLEHGIVKLIQRIALLKSAEQVGQHSLAVAYFNATGKVLE